MFTNDTIQGHCLIMTLPSEACMLSQGNAAEQVQRDSEEPVLRVWNQAG